MARGRDICNTLKAIRKQIADANGIAYSPEECHFTGECKGTCPKCEQDVRDLEYELRRRQIAGKAIKVVGIAAGLVALTACSDGKPQRNASDMVTGETIIVKKEEPNPRNRQLEGAISLGNKEKLLEEENRKDGEASYNPSLETKEIKKNIKGNSSKNQGNRAATHTTNNESLATIFIHDISLVLDKENVSKRALSSVSGYLHGLYLCRLCVPDDILGV